MPSDARPPREEQTQIEAWFAEQLGVEVELAAFEQRTASRLYRYRTGGSAPTRLVVKVPLVRAAPYSDPRRPRLMPPTLAERKARLELEALRAVERHVAGLADRRFAAVEVLGLVQPFNALVMREAPGTSLRALAVGALVPGRRDATRRATAAVGNAGAWLRSYHGIKPADGTERRLATGAEVGALATAIGNYLQDAPYGRQMVEIAGGVSRGAREVLGAGSLPLVVVHGDFAMRNVIVAQDGTIRVVDMLARWQAPVHEDLATMLAALEGIGLGIRLGGLLPPPPFVRRAETAFLDGYFGGLALVPRASLAVFGALLMLDRLAAWHERGGRQPGPTQRGLLRIAGRHLREIQ